MSKTNARTIVKKAATEIFYARDVQDIYSALVSIRRIQQLLQKAVQLPYSRVKRAPALTEKQKSLCVLWRGN
eukprot:IDg7847t1